MLGWYDKKNLSIQCIFALRKERQLRLQPSSRKLCHYKCLNNLKRKNADERKTYAGDEDTEE